MSPRTRTCFPVTRINTGAGVTSVNSRAGRSTAPRKGSSPISIRSSSGKTFSPSSTTSVAKAGKRPAPTPWPTTTSREGKSPASSKWLASRSDDTVTGRTRRVPWPFLRATAASGSCSCRVSSTVSWRSRSPRPSARRSRRFYCRASTDSGRTAASRTCCSRWKR